MIRSATIAAIGGLSALTLFPRSAAADDVLKQTNKADYVVPTAPAGDKKDAPPEGWAPRIAAGLTLSFGDNRSVVGQADGGTLSFGLKFDAGLDYRRGGHEWRNTLALAEGVTRTPVMPQFLKSADLLSIESIYLYHVTPWFGPFARASLLTALFRGEDVRPGATTYLIKHVDGTIETKLEGARSSFEDPVVSTLPLSDPFLPMTLKQSVGPFLRPIESEKVNLELRAGLGAQETLAKKQLAVADDHATPEIEINELSSVNQLGVEAAADLWGAVSDKRVTYRVGIDAMIPVAHTALPASDHRSSIDLMNLEMGGQLSFKLVEWASLDYQIKAIREPQIIDAFQVRNTLLLTLGLGYGFEKK
ncbi:MAG: hypothetical protein ABJE95_39670 [Byssovorax sp.]